MRGVKEYDLVVCQLGIGHPSIWMIFEMPLLSGGVVMVRGCPRVNLSVFLTKRSVTAMVRRQLGHPEATGSIRLDK